VRTEAPEHTDAVLQRASIQRGYTLVIWRGRHVVEPFQLTDAEASEYWRDVLAVARVLNAFHQPLKMNYETLGNTVPRFRHVGRTRGVALLRLTGHTRCSVDG
jgi:diadenosine tetraphosphate (Ap4A) HIT family hydrolase